MDNNNYSNNFSSNNNETRENTTFNSESNTSGYTGSTNSQTSYTGSTGNTSGYTGSTNVGSGYTANSTSENTNATGSTYGYSSYASSSNGSYSGNATGSSNGSYSGNATGSGNGSFNGNTTGTNTYSEGRFDNSYNPYERVNGNAYSNQQPPKKKKKGGFGATLGKVVAASLVFAIVGGATFTGVSYLGCKGLGIIGQSSTSSSSKTNSSTSVSKTSTGNATDLTDVSSIVDEVMPSIVAITNTGTVTYQSFFGQTSQETESCGSGIIIDQTDKYLYIATNNHVVADAETLSVQFCDDETVDAEIRGTDESDDLAVVMVKISDIPDDTLSAIKVATIGDSEKVSVGDASIAIGNALGYGQSVTTGVISALNRSVSSQDETTGVTVTNNNLLQTDAAINPGNSGGALLNSAGEVIGINSVKYASTEVEGIGYAIPMADAMPILQSLIDDGSYTDTQSAYLGIQGADVSTDMSAYNIPTGVYVSSVVSGSGAAKAGIQQGDIITSFNGTDISSMSELQSLLSGCRAGDKVKVTVSRQSGNGYKEQNLEVTLSSSSEVNQ